MLSSCSSLDTITVFQNITDGETIVSGNERFELGFFSPGSSKNRYLGIWYKNTSPRTVLWVANRETPLIDTSGVVKLDSNGNLSLVNGSGSITWSSNSSASGTNVNPIAKLLDTGNFVIMSENLLNKENYIWQSFDHPGDTYIPGMKLGKNFVTGREIYLTSWRSTDDPSPGEYTFRFLMVKGKYVQLYLRKSSVITIRFGPYTGMSFAGHPNIKPDPTVLYKSELIVNQNEMYYMYTYDSPRFLLHSVATPDGKIEVFQLNLLSQEWMINMNFPGDYCDNYGICGPYGICSTSTIPNCVCLKGFELKNPQELNPYNGTSGCQRSRTLDCGPEEGFLKFSNMKLPDTQNAVYDTNMNLQECEVACKRNCSCTAYAIPNITAGGVGCLQWFGNLVDVRVYPQNGQDLYVRLAASELSGKPVHN